LWYVYVFAYDVTLCHYKGVHYVCGGLLNTLLVTPFRPEWQ